MPKKTQGQDYNYFKKLTVNNLQFNTDADVIITFKTSGLILHTESAGTVEYSMNGNTVHGELVFGSNRATLNFTNRNACMIWFRLKSGSNVPVSVEAWAQD